MNERKINYVDVEELLPLGIISNHRAIPSLVKK